MPLGLLPCFANGTQTNLLMGPSFRASAHAALWTPLCTTRTMRGSSPPAATHRTHSNSKGAHRQFVSKALVTALNVVAFYAGWLACVVGAAHGHLALGPAVV